jgi:hypothetical protein
MDRETIRVGDQYGYRKYPQRRGTRLERIEVLEKVRPGKWKVRFSDDPYPGLIDYVRSGNLLVSWSEQEAFLDDERRLLKILEVSATQWSGQLDDPVAGAINWTLNATGEGDTFLYDYGGISTVDLVQKWRAAWTLARQWSKSASADKAKITSMEEIRQRVENSMNLLWIKIGEIDRKKTEEIQRLRSMLLRAADDFKALGAMEKADHLISSLHKDQKLRE